jgi:uncharacterized protein YbjT (DUF2867 family)
MKLLLKILGGFVLLIVVLVAWLAIMMSPTIPEDTFELQPVDAVGGLNVMVFGATGNLGREVVADLVEQGDKVTAFVRTTSDRSALGPLGVEFAVGDAMELDTIVAAFEQGEYDAAIATIGSFQAEIPPDYIGNANIADAAKVTGVKRMILISTVGAGDSIDAAPLPSRIVLSKILPLKTQAEDHLKASGLDYTIIRPGGLPYTTNSTGRGLLSEDRNTMGFILRADLARLIVGVLHDDRTIGKTFAAVDPELTYPGDTGE